MRKLYLLSFIFIFISACGQQNNNTIKQTKVKSSAIRPVRAAIGAIGGALSDDIKVENFKIKQDESLYVLLSNFGFSPAEIYRVAQKAKKVFDVRSFRPGQPYKAYVSESDTSGMLKKLVWHPNPVDFVVFNWSRDSLQIYKASKPIRKELSSTGGTITSSLYNAITDEEARDELVYMMTEILAWQIDFFNLRDGDTFKILYEKKYVGDTFYDLGKVKAIKFMHMGDTYFAYKFVEGEFDGYFDEEGNSVQKALLKTPFKYDYRISSGFNPRRFHPILHKYRAHTGTDYAAPYGTPVMATGDGVVVTAGYVGAAGNMVKIKHNGTYKTAYMHMKGFANGIHKGTHVKQGQIIGYVGSTGRSTGAHLHYSVYRNDAPVNSLKLDLPPSLSIPEKFMDEFGQVRDRLHEDMMAQDSMIVAK